MTGVERAQGFLAGLLAGVAGGLFGVGGGIVLVPMLTGRFRLTQHQAHGTSLAVIGITALAGVVVYAISHQVAWITAALVALSSIGMARYGARRASRTSTTTLRRAFAALLAIAALKLLLWPPVVTTALTHSGWSSAVFDLALGAAVGLFAGYLGVGGGMIAVPALTIFFGMSQQAAQGTSLAVILVTGPVGALEHSRHGNVMWRLVPMLALGAVVGSPLSSWVAQITPHDTLVRLFAIFLLVNAVLTWLRKPPAERTAKGASDT